MTYEEAKEKERQAIDEGVKERWNKLSASEKARIALERMLGILSYTQGGVYEFMPLDAKEADRVGGTVWMLKQTLWAIEHNKA